MPKENYTVTVDRELEGLIPEYIKNREEELQILRTSLAGEDFEELRRRGHRMKGVGVPYGFDQVSELGAQIEDGAKAKNKAVLDKLVNRYATFLSRVTIVWE